MKRPEFLRGKRIFLPVIPLIALTIAGTLAIRKRNSLSLLGEAKQGPAIEAVYGLGTVTAERSYQLKLGVSSTVRKLWVREGDFVPAHSPLIELDANGVFSAPFDGTVTSVPFKLGESVFPQTPILTLVDLTRRYLVVSLEQQGALQVRKGQPVDISLESLREKHFHGKVRALFSNESQFWAHLEVEGLPPEVLPGMTADVAIEVNRKDNVILVPASGVSGGQVLRSRSGTREQVVVEPGISDGAWVEVRSGDVKPGDQIWVANPPAK